MPRVLHFPAVLTTVVQGTLAIAAGDSICQRLEGKEKWDSSRTARMAITGCCLVTPMAHYLFVGLEHAFPGRTLVNVLAKSGLNSLCTVLFIAGSFTGNALLSRKSLGTLKKQLDDRLMPTYMVGLQYWPMANVLLYQLSKQAWRGVGGMVAGTVWSVYLSSRLNAKNTMTATNTTTTTTLARRNTTINVKPRLGGGGGMVSGAGACGSANATATTTTTTNVMAISGQRVR